VLKRILTILTSMVFGSLLAIGLIHAAHLLGIVGDREARQSARYYQNVLELVRERYVDPEKIELDGMTRDALRGMLRGLDAHSNYLRASDYEHLRENLDSKFGGIGIQIEYRDGFVVVITPIADSPGERAGILRGDRVLMVDEESMMGKSINEVVDRMRGEPGTSVDVVFERPGQDDPVEISVVREVIRVESVREATMIEPGIGYLRIVQFSGPTAEETLAAIERLLADGMESLIIDVRNNPGGLLSVAADVLEPFFPRGELMVYTEGRLPTDRAEYRSAHLGPVWDFPVVVLINRGSASAAEILAGALKDTDRAWIIGEQSFGKGSVQTLLPLRTGEALRLTTARYYTPGGVTIHEVGVSPDEEIAMSPEDDLNVALQRNRPDIDDPGAFEERFGFAPVADVQLAAAIEYLQRGGEPEDTE
jgi:carboxyl-terminal processing protease